MVHDGMIEKKKKKSMYSNGYDLCMKKKNFFFK